MDKTGSELRRLVVDEGSALEIYWDGSRYVVVLPKGQRSIDPRALRDLGLQDVATITAKVRQDDIDAVMAHVANLAHSNRAPFETYFDVHSGW